jgi:hypothetical protein
MEFVIVKSDILKMKNKNVYNAIKIVKAAVLNQVIVLSVTEKFILIRIIFKIQEIYLILVNAYMDTIIIH